MLGKPLARSTFFPRKKPDARCGIGAVGALALLSDSGDLIDVADMPIRGRPTVNGPLLAEIVIRSRASLAFVEFVGTRSGEGAVGAFAFGRSRGVVEGVLAACAILATHIAPAA